MKLGKLRFSRQLVYIAALSLCVLVASVNANEEIPRPIVVTSVPKSGTHLLLKALRVMTGKSAKWVLPDDSTLESCLASEQTRIFVNHFGFSEKREALLVDSGAKVFHIYRDPRDQVISYANWELRVRPGRYSSFTCKELIRHFIRGDEGYLHMPQATSLTEFYAAFASWRTSPIVCSVKFEDLVGPSGGGSHTRQLEALEQIADHLEIHFTDRQLNKIAEDLFGGTRTFKSGQIGEWKAVFDIDDIRLFKVENGQLLIDLGYEEDEAW